MGADRVRSFIFTATSIPRNFLAQSTTLKPTFAAFHKDRSGLDLHLGRSLDRSLRYLQRWLLDTTRCFIALLEHDKTRMQP